MAVPLLRIDSTTSPGSGLPPLRSMTSAPASCTSQSKLAPDASSTRLVASAISGPVPSPGMSVTRWLTRISSFRKFTKAYRTTFGFRWGWLRRMRGRIPRMADKGGLEGVVVARSRLCSIDGINGVLIYSGYDVGDLAEHSTYEE